MQQAMRAARFLVLPSLGYEMCPLTVLEAFANRLPVICSDLPSLAHLIEDGVTGLKSHPIMPPLLRPVCGKRCWDGKSRDDGRRAECVYAARYTPEVNVRQLMEIYSSARSDSRNQA